MIQEEERCCGGCCMFCFELLDGEGQCMDMADEGYPMMMMTCDSKACDEYVGREQMRHYMAVLLQYNRWRRSNEDCRMPNPTELGRAIDFAVKYMKVFSKL